MSKDLERLEALTRMTFDAELAKLRASAEALVALQAEVGALNKQLRDRGRGLQEAPEGWDFARGFGQDARWQVWITQEKRRLNLAIASKAAEMEAQKRVAKRAFGRLDAIAGLREKASADRKVAAARRLDAANSMQAPSP